MEEYVGKKWHGFITAKSVNNYPHEMVELHDVSNSINTLFRAFGGDAGVRVEACTPEDHGARRNWLQRLAGSQKKAAVAWCDGETLRLPEKIDLYPDKGLNRDLYYWLAAMAAMDPEGANRWIVENQQRALMALKRFPGLSSRYQRLVVAELQRRPDWNQLPKDEAEQEKAILCALLDPGSVVELPVAKNYPHPVFLWMNPAPLFSDELHFTETQPDQAEEDQEGQSHDGQQQHRYRAKEVAMPEGKDGLITIRWENIFSWAEYIKVNRANDEEFDENAAETAKDMEVLSIAKDQQTSSSRLRLDLDLPSPEYDDTPLSGRVMLPEWDWRKQSMLDDFCVIHLMLPRGSEAKPLPPELSRTARRLRGQFSALTQNRVWQKQLQDGSELDMQAYLDFTIQRHQGQVQQPSLYRDLRRTQRDLATLLLADLSLSTDAAVNDNQRVIDVIRDSLLLFSEALSACGDRFALYGFSSRKRDQVRYYHLKQFGDPYDDTVRGHIQAIKPGYYTRMGAAIRHSTNILKQQPVSKRLLLILTDGKPNDLDRYEGRYGIEDTRKAILEARNQGLLPFCITIDHKADDYLPHLFGRDGYTLIRTPEELPKKLLNLYIRLTGNRE